MIKEIHAKSLLRKMKKIDSWFVARYGMNLYRGCTHDCSYCDGRAEGYYVDGEFGKDVEVKVNAPELLRHELDPARKRRKPLPKGFFMIGGGVGDSYQPVENKYGLTKSVLEIMLEGKLPVSLLTKSSLVSRDRELICRINAASRAVVSFSLSCADDGLAGIFETGASRPSARLETLRQFAAEGVACGIYLMPVIPFVTDTVERMEETVSRAKEAGASFVIFGGMTLKEGRQKDFFLKVLEKYDSSLAGQYGEIYGSDPYGASSGKYYPVISGRFSKIAKKYRMPVRIPERIYRDWIEPSDLPIIRLETLDYLLKLENRPSRYGWIAYKISQLKPEQGWDKALTCRKDEENVVREIFETGKCTLLDDLKWWE